MKKETDVYLFRIKYPNVFEKYKIYKNYYFRKTNVKDKFLSDYNSVLFKSLIAFFIYQEGKKSKKITLKTIANILGYKSHTTVIYSINKIKNLLLYQPKYQVNGKDIKKLFLIFNGISCNNNFK